MFIMKIPVKEKQPKDQLEKTKAKEENQFIKKTTKKLHIIGEKQHKIEKETAETKQKKEQKRIKSLLILGNCLKSCYSSCCSKFQEERFHKITGKDKNDFLIVNMFTIASCGKFTYSKARHVSPFYLIQNSKKITKEEYEKQLKKAIKTIK